MTAIKASRTKNKVLWFPTMKDPRLTQILFLTTLFLFGVFGRDFSLSYSHILWVIGTALFFQLMMDLLNGESKKSYRSALISAISVLLLCRSQYSSLMAMVAGLAISSKFLFRHKGKHFFNPTCFGIVVMLLYQRSVWVSPAQWGENVLILFWIFGLGLMVVTKTGRNDISLTFLSSYFLLLFARVLYLGQSSAILWHQLESGSLIIFTFFMISDPRSTPDHRVGRVIFAISVAILAYILRFHFYKPNALLYALFFLSPITILIDNLWKHRRFEWGKQHVETASRLHSSPSVA